MALSRQWASVSPRVVNYTIVLVVWLLHLAIAPLVSLGVDEAHYALHPALSYYDHPPLVGWLKMVVAPLSYNEFTLRLVPLLIYPPPFKMLRCCQCSLTPIS